MNKRVFLLWLAVGLLCLGLLFTPSGWAAIQRMQLIRTSTPRPAGEGLLTEQARSIPALYALHAASSLEQTLTWEESQDARADLQCLLDEIPALEAAGVFTAKDRAVLEQYLLQEEFSLQTAKADLLLCFSGSSVQEPPVPSRYIEWQMDTQEGLLVSASLPLIAEQTAPQMLAAYRAYLGVDALSDWQTVNLPEGLGGENAAALWSAQGQAYLYCACDGWRTFLGLYAMSREELDALFDAGTL